MSSLRRQRQSFAWFGRSPLPGPALSTCLALPAAGPARAAAAGEASTQPETRLPSEAVPSSRRARRGSSKICRNQTYALCAVASCYVFNQVAYCKCEVKHGNSISLPFKAHGTDVCDVTGAGPANG